jgi:transcriptional regulator with XRE-family HTH domain
VVTSVRPWLTPTVARRLLSYELTRMVSAAGITHAAMGERLQVSRASFSQLLAGKSLPSRAVLEVVLGHLDALSELPRLADLLRLARSGPQTPSLGDRDLLCGLESYAHRIEVYDPLVISPLFGGGRRGLLLDAEQAPEVTWVVEEHALRRSQSGAHERLRALRDTVTVQVLPWSRDAHAGLRGGFEVVHGASHAVVCEETRRVNLYHDHPAVVAEYMRLFAALQTLALDPERSQVMLAKR